MIYLPACPFWLFQLDRCVLSLYGLRHSEGFVRSPLPALLLRPDGVIAGVNPALEHWLGVDAATVLGEGLHRLEGAPGEWLAAVEVAVLRAQPQPVRVCHANGRSIPALLMAAPIKDADGELKALYVQLTDVQRPTSMLVALQTLLNVLPGVGVLSFDLDSRYLQAGGELFRRTGMEASALVGRTLQDVVAPDAYQRLQPMYDAILRGQVTAVDHPLQDGALIALTGLPLRDPVTQHVVGGLLVGRELDSATPQPRDALDLAAVLEHTEGALVLCDVTGQILRWSRGAAQLYGWTDAEVRGKPLPAVLGPACYGPSDDPQQRLCALLAAGSDQVTTEHWVRGQQVVPVRARFAVVPGPEPRLVLLATDHSDQLAESRARRDAERRFEGAFWTSPIGMAMVGLDGRLLHVNPKLCELLGYPREELLAHTFLTLTHPDDLQADVANVQRLLAGEARSYRMQKRYLHKTGRVVWAQLSVALVHDDDGAPQYFVSQLEDIAERKAADEMLRALAFRDPLTSLGNRRLLIERLAQQLTRRDQSPALVVVDVDRFQVINDSFGHVAGDRVLCEVANRLHSVCSGDELAVRLAADAFVLLLSHSSGDLVELAERIRLAATFLMAMDDREIAVTVSVGLAQAQAGDTPEGLLKVADATLLRAKRKGRGRSEVLDADKRRRVRVRQDVERDLQGALSRGEFRLQYQPVVALATGELAGFEALVRWQHPTRGLRPPGEFLGVAADIGLLHALDGYVLHSACHDLADWREAAMKQKPWRTLPLQPALGNSTLAWHVSINLGPEELQHMDTVTLVSEALQRSGVPPQQVWIEITETALLEPTPRVVRCITALRDLGVCISIDDFGTGYASFSYLQRFPVDVIKIDRSFVADLAGNTTGAAIVRASLTLATSLGLDVVAEGVETLEQATILRELGCRYGQGWLFGRPMFASKVSGRWLAGNPAARLWPDAV